MVVTSSDNGREQGIEFGHLADELAAVEYPVDKATLLAEFGDRELVLEDGTRTLRQVIEPLGEDSFESADAVIQSVLGMVDEEAVGRKEYTDRGGHTKLDEESEESI